MCPITYNLAKFALNMTQICPKLAQFGLKSIPNLLELAQNMSHNYPTLGGGAGSHALHVPLPFRQLILDAQLSRPFCRCHGLCD